MEVTCRYDWHQTGSHVIISVFAKAVDPDLSYVEANAVKINIHLAFGQDSGLFDLQLPLFGVSHHRVQVPFRHVRFVMFPFRQPGCERRPEQGEHARLEGGN